MLMLELICSADFDRDERSYCVELKKNDRQN